MPDRQVNKWSQRVTHESNALDLEPGVFTFEDPRRIARSLKRSADGSNRRKAEPFRSAMSMLVFYINRAGRNMPARQKKRLEAAKDELRALYHRPARTGTRASPTAARRTSRRAAKRARTPTTASTRKRPGKRAAKRGAR